MRRRKVSEGANSPHIPVAKCLHALEPRFLFDAAGLATGAEATADATAQEQAEQAVDDDPSPAAPNEGPSAAHNTTADDKLLQALATHEPPAARREIVFVDTSVKDYETLIAGIDPNAETILLDANRDGVQQIRDALQGRSGVDAIHIISNGDQAELWLGTARLTQASMQHQYADELSDISRALSDNADILIYGCNFGQGGLGQQGVDELAKLTGADVAASEDATGHATLGGDWDLESTIGQIDTAVAVSESAQEEWSSVLATPIGPEFLVNTEITGVQETDFRSPQAVATDADGDFVVTWTSNLAQDGSGLGVFAQRYDAAGVPQGGEFRVNTYTTNDQQWSKVAIDPNGNFVVTWASSAQDGSGLGVFAQRYDAAGMAQGAEFRVNTTTTSAQERSTAAMDADGDFVITWSSDNQDGSGRGVYAQRYNAAGVPQGGEFRVNTTTAGPQRYSSLAMDATGDFVVVWSGDGPGDVNGVFAQRYAQPGITVTPTSGLVTTEDGGTATFSVWLNTAPTANVTIGISSNDTTEGTVSTSSLTFTPANWNVPQVVTVTGVSDFLTDGNVPYTIVTAPASSADPAYNGLNASDVSVTNRDGGNDAPVNTVPGPQSTNEDTMVVFSSGNGNQISIADVDAGSNPVQVTLIATNGTLTLNGTAGLTFGMRDAPPIPP